MKAQRGPDVIWPVEYERPGPDPGGKRQTIEAPAEAERRGIKERIRASPGEGYSQPSTRPALVAFRGSGARPTEFTGTRGTPRTATVAGEAEAEPGKPASTHERPGEQHLARVRWAHEGAPNSSTEGVNRLGRPCLATSPTGIGGVHPERLVPELKNKETERGEIRGPSDG